MHSLFLTQHVDAPPERVFAVMTDLEHAAEHFPALRSLELLTAGPVQRGTRFRATRTVLGRPYTEEMEVLEHEPPEHYVIGCDSHGFQIVSRFHFQPRPNGTQVELSLEATPKTLAARLMGPLVGKLLARVGEEASADLAALAAAAEGRPAR